MRQNHNYVKMSTLQKSGYLWSCKSWSLVGYCIFLHKYHTWYYNKQLIHCFIKNNKTYYLKDFLDIDSDYNTCFSITTRYQARRKNDLIINLMSTWCLSNFIRIIKGSCFGWRSNDSRAQDIYTSNLIIL